MRGGMSGPARCALGVTPSVSVIIPVYNDSVFLSHAVGSVLAQGCNLEVIIVDDGSEDDTPAVAARLVAVDPRVRHIRKPNGGLSSARNAGVRASRGAYLQFLDADDALESGKLSEQVAHLEAHPEVGITYSDVRYFTTEDLGGRRLTRERPDGPLQSATPWVEELADRPGSWLQKLLDHNLCPVNCPLVRRSVLDAVGPWNEGLRALEDWEYWLRCAAAGVQFAYHSKPGMMALVRYRSDSLSSKRDVMARSAVEMRVSCGPALPTSCARLANFRHGRRLSANLRARGHVGRVLRLAWANRSRHVLLEACGAPVAQARATAMVWSVWHVMKPALPRTLRDALRRFSHRRRLGGR